MKDDRPDDPAEVSSNEPTNQPREDASGEPREGEAFEPFPRETGESILVAISRLHNLDGSILLREPQDGEERLVFQRKEEEAASDSRFHIVGEIARGGIGIVYRGRDRDLNRDIALKVLRPEFAEREDVVARFIEEAQVGGQLQHPGIVPVYGLGLQSDGRPSFSMKLIKGRTLADLLQSNPKGIDLLSVFEAVALTIAYTHSRRVIHRDLKPANIMIGSFGEVLVVDWGFGKVIGRDEVARQADGTIIATLRSSGRSDSMAGSVMGTPAYMPPEQALGRVDDLDERADVFSLGAILCEILTGEAPYTGEVRDQLVAATQCRLDDAYARLDAADAPEPLKKLCRDCLQPLPPDRPRHAGIVEERMAAHFAAVESEALKSELDALEAENRIAKERRKRKNVLTLSAVAAISIIAMGGGYLWWKGARDAREARAAPLVAEALREAGKHEVIGDWAGAVASAQRAVDVARSEGVDDTEARAALERLESEQAEHAKQLAIREQDDALLAELVAIRNLAPGSTKTVTGAGGGTGLVAMAPETWDRPGDRHKAMDAAYATAFESRFGSIGGGQERLRASRHAPEFAANIGYWCWLRKTMPALEGSDWRSLDTLAREIDPASIEIRDALVTEDGDALLEAVEARGDMLPLALVSQVAMNLIDLGRPQDAIDFLLPWNRRHPDEIMIHIRIALAARELAIAEDDPDEVDAALAQLELAIRHANAAVALRPEVDVGWYNLGLCLASAGEFEDAAHAFGRVVKLTPGYIDAYNRLADAQLHAHNPKAALATIEAALKVQPDDEGFLVRRGVILSEHLGDDDRAIDAFKQALTHSTDSWSANVGLALSYARNNDPDEARAAIREARERGKDSALAHAEIGRCYIELEDYDKAIEVTRQAIRMDKHQHGAYVTLGYAFQMKERLDEAIDAYDNAIELAPTIAAPYVHLSRIHLDRGNVTAALDAARSAVEFAPRNAEARARLADTLLASGDPSRAETEAEEGVELDPTNGWNYVYLARARSRQNNLEGALEAAREGTRRAPTLAATFRELARIHALRGDRTDAIAAHRRFVNVDREPDAKVRHPLALAQLYETLGDRKAARREFEAAAKADPEHLEATLGVGRMALQTADPDGAIEWFTKVVALDDTHARAHALLGIAHLEKNELDKARREIERSRSLGEQHWYVAMVLGDVLNRQSNFDQAVEVLEESLKGNSRSFRSYHLLGIAHAGAGDREEAEKAFRDCLNINVNFVPAWSRLGLLLAEMGASKESLAMHRKAVELSPDDPIARGRLGIQLWHEGLFDESAEELSKIVDELPNYAAALENVKKSIELAKALPDVLAGKKKPADAEEKVAFAEVARHKKDYAGSTRLYAEAFASDADVAADVKTNRLYNAACSAVLAGKEHHAQALAWLRADLELCRKLVESDPDFLRMRLPHSQRDPDLKVVRDALDRPDEWKQYWSDVDELIRLVQKGKR